MSPTNRIFFIDPRGNFNFDDVDVVERHEKYLRDYEAKFGKKLAIQVLGVRTISHSRFLEGVAVTNRTRNIFRFAQNSRWIFKNDSSVTLVASDPWFSFASCLAIKSSSKKRVRIQLQLHGQYLAKNQKRLLNKVSERYILWCIEQADETRFVNAAEYEIFSKKNPSVASKSFQMPVPINPVFLEGFRDLIETKPLSLGFIGRLHPERGTELFIEIASGLKRTFPKLRVVVIGDGPEWELVKGKLTDHFAGDFEMLGHLSPTELKEQMKKIGVLLSCAPMESYGRSMREAILLGIPVLALESDGARQLQGILPGTAIQLFSRSEETLQLEEKFDNLRRSSFSSMEIFPIIGLDSEGTSKLIDSWHRLIHN